MAENVNVGIAPPDLESKVGMFRVQIGDTAYVPLDPPEEGQGSYRYLSDAEIRVYLNMANGNLFRALGDYNLALSNEAAENSKIVKDHDLQLSTVQRANDYRRIAIAWYQRADGEDASSGGQDIFDAFSLGGNREFIPEGTIGDFGREYVWTRL